MTAASSNTNSTTSRPTPQITEEVVAAWRQRIRADTFSHYHFSMGQTLRTGGDLAAATLAFERAVAISPGFSRAQQALRDTLAERGMAAEAEAVHRQALSVDPDYLDRARLDEARIDLENGLLEVGAPVLRATLKTHPDWKPEFLDAIRRTAFLLEGKLDYKGMGEWYEMVVDVRPDDAEAHYKLARSHIARNDYQNAEKHLLRARKLTPWDREIWHLLSFLLLCRLHPSQAVRAERKALALAPDCGFSEYWHLALASLCIGHREGAIQLGAWSARVSPQPLSLGGHALALLAAGRNGEAVTRFREATNIGEANAWVLAGLGLALHSREENDEALRCLGRAVELGTNVNWVQSSLGYVLTRLGRRDEGMAAVRKGMEAEPHVVGFDLWSRPWTVETLRPLYAELGLPIGAPT